MSDFGSIILRAVVSMVGSLIGIFEVFQSADRHISKGSIVGESRLDREAHDWREKLLVNWQWMAFGLVALAGLLGGGYWLLSH